MQDMLVDALHDLHNEKEDSDSLSISGNSDIDGLG